MAEALTQAQALMRAEALRTAGALKKASVKEVGQQVLRPQVVALSLEHASHVCWLMVESTILPSKILPLAVTVFEQSYEVGPFERAGSQATHSSILHSAIAEASASSGRSDALGARFRPLHSHQSSIAGLQLTSG